MATYLQICCIVCILVFVKGSLGDQLLIFVDGTNGNDGNPGSIDKPFKTIVFARDYIRQLKNASKFPVGGVTVNIRSGSYNFTSEPFSLKEEDSGKPDSPIIYQAYNGENVLLHAGVELPIDQFTAVTDPYVLSLLQPQVKNKIVQVDLKKLGISSYGNIESQELGQCGNDKLELYFNKTRMILARYPNIDQNGTWQFMQVIKVVNNNTFQFSDSRINQWKDISTLWLHGFWQYDWADNYVKVLSIDRSSNEFITDPKTPPVFGFLPKARYYCVNILEEIDVPSEYYVNRSSGMLYFYPPPQWKSGQTFVSVGESLIVMNYVSYVTIRGLQMMYSRTTAVEANGVSNVNIMDCEIGLQGDSSIILHGTNCTISDISVHDNGCGGIHMSGGDQKSLTRGNNVVTKCNISHYSHWKRTYQPAISWAGVGNNVTYNSISHAPHMGIIGKGNDCLFEYNHFANLCYEVTDSGAFYSGRSWIDRGNIVRHSYFENIRITEKTVLGSMVVKGIYLDDEMSGFEIYNNTFKNCQVGTFIGGGRRNHVHNNQYYNCSVAVHEDNRGMTWRKDFCSPGGIFEQQLKSVNYQQPPWSQHYPFLVNIFNDHPCVPVYNNITDNIYCNTEQFTDLSTEDAKEWLDILMNNNKKC